tara:strand:+ start:1519 stop:2265 length:747 start_codon:yes stop_codon:yes gene_type:complete
MSLPAVFKPKKNFSLVRLGRNNDGGYLIGNNSIKNSKCLISFGILDDCSFESDFKRENSVEIFCFDLTDYKSYWVRRIYNDLGASIYNLNFSFLKTIKRYFEFKKFFKKEKNFLFRKNIIKGSFKEIIEKSNLIKKPFLIKIDIEGSEYRLLEEILFYQKFLTGLVIEFHDVDLNQEKISEFIKNFNLELTHIHPNNFGQIDENGDPKVIEMTFEKIPLIKEGSNILPNDLDQPCDSKNKEIKLNFLS